MRTDLSRELKHSCSAAEMLCGLDVCANEQKEKKMFLVIYVVNCLFSVSFVISMLE